MSKKTINQALKDVFLNLGGDPTELSDNTSVSDYIEDLGGAIEDAAGGAAEAIIDDTAASETKTYSSSKIESIIPEGLPAVTSSDVLKGLQVNASGKWEVGYIDVIRNNQCGIIEGSEELTVSLYKALTTAEIAGIQFLRIPFDNKTLLFCAVDYGTFQAVYRETGKTTYYSFSISASTQPFTDIPVTKEVVNDPT